MKKIWIIAWKDFKTYFTSPMGYVIIASFLVVMGYMFFSNLAYFLQSQIRFQFGQGKGATITDGIIRPLYGNLNVFFLFFAPFITMRLLAEERKLQTLQLLATAPITQAQIVLGKFLSGVLMVITMLAATAVYPIILIIYGNPDIGPILTSYMGTFFMFSSYIALGLFFSSMTEHQMVACALTFGVGLFFWLINWAAQSAGPIWSDILDYLSVIQHYNNFSQGVIDSTDVVFFLSFIGIFLFLTHRVLDSYRWR